VWNLVSHFKGKIQTTWEQRVEENIRKKERKSERKKEKVAGELRKIHSELCNCYSSPSLVWLSNPSSAKTDYTHSKQDA
jgi:hypothetical protein